MHAMLIWPKRGADMRRFVVVLLGVTMLVLGLVSPVTGVGAAPLSRAERGASGLGDPYFPLDGNGGYDVGHYNPAVNYDPPPGSLARRRTLTGPPTQNPSRF